MGDVILTGLSYLPVLNIGYSDFVFVSARPGATYRPYLTEVDFPASIVLFDTVIEYNGLGQGFRISCFVFLILCLAGSVEPIQVLHQRWRA